MATLAIDGDELVVARSSASPRPAAACFADPRFPRLVTSCADPQEQVELVRRAQRGP
jgi:hypothetical protein